MNWLALALTTSVGFALYNFFLKVAADKINPFLAVFYLTLTATVVSGITLLILRALNYLPVVQTSKSGLTFIILAGIATGVADLLYLILFSRGQSLNVVLPLIFALAVALAVIMSTIFLHEPLSPIKIVGILFALVGVAILSKY